MSLDSAIRKGRKVVAKVLGKATDLNLLVRSAAAYSTTTGTVEVTSIEVPIVGRVWTATKGERAGVEAGDYRVRVAASAIETALATAGASTTAPTTSDRLEIDGDEYQIVDVEEEWAKNLVGSYVISGRS